MTVKDRIGKRIAALRKEQGLTQEDIAQITGIKQQNIARIEAGQHSTGLDILAKISEALGCEVNINEKRIELITKIL